MTLRSELHHEIRQAAADVLNPVVHRATTTATVAAVERVPRTVDKFAPVVIAGGGAVIVAAVTVAKRARATGARRLARGVASKLSRTGGRRPSPALRRRGRLPVQEQIDVAVDASTAYDRFTRFREWPEFMGRVETVAPDGDGTLRLSETVWGVRRAWEAEIVEEIPADRLVWRSTGADQTVGVATFHRLDANLTRVQVSLDSRPSGLLEKTASSARMSRRALRSDLERFRAAAELAMLRSSLPSRRPLTTRA